MTVPNVTAGQEKSPRSPILVKKPIIRSSSQGCRKMKMPVESTCSLDSDYDIEERPLFNENPEPSGATEMLQEVLNMSTEGDLLEDIPSEEIFSFLEVISSTPAALFQIIILRGAPPALSLIQISPRSIKFPLDN